MRNRVLLAAGAIALVAASCAQPEPQVLSEASHSASATEITSPTTTTERDEQPGRFIARCATEADGGTPGLTIFTDGSRNVTDHCLSRYYIGVQPAPGALYVPDEEAGTYAPPSEKAPVETTGEQWTPAQPRTDIGFEDDRDLLEGEETTRQPVVPDTEDPDTDDAPETPETPETPTDGTSPTSPTSPTTPPTTDPGGTEPRATDPSTPGTTEAGETTPAGPGLSEQTTVPTVTEAQPGPLTSVMSADSADPSDPVGPTRSQAATESGTSVGFPVFPWPGSFWPGGPQS